MVWETTKVQLDTKEGEEVEEKNKRQAQRFKLVALREVDVEITA